MFEKVFDEQFRALEPEIRSKLPEIARNPCDRRYPQVWAGDRQCTLDIGHLEAGDPVHQHLNLYFWHENSMRPAKPVQLA